MRLPSACLLAVFAASAATAAVEVSPRQAWLDDIAKSNKHYSADTYAILKIQDAAYIREGDAATLVGRKGQPGSYHWVNGMKPGGVLVAGVRQGFAFVMKDKHLYKQDEIAKGIAIDTDVAVRGQQTQIDAGVIGARIWIYNQHAKAAQQFAGLRYFDYDPSFIATGSFKPDPARPARVFHTSRGTGKQFFHAGDATFTLKGKSFTLPFFAESADPKEIKSISAFFTDGLTGRETYGAGRYIDVDVAQYPPKQLKLDFNYAYNPNCARSAYYTCPYAQDNLNIDIRAGEKDPHKAH